MRTALFFTVVLAFFVSGGASATITFTEGDDSLEINAGNYEEIADLGELRGRDGDDYINVGRGFGLSGIAVYGEEGDDVLWGSAHHASLDGGRGDDVLHGGEHGNHVWGGPGNDTFFPHTATDVNFYYRGLDEIRGFTDIFWGTFGTSVHFTEFTVAFLEEYLFAVPIGANHYKLGLRGHNVGIFAEIAPLGEIYGRIHGTDGTIDFASITVPNPPTVVLLMAGLLGLSRAKSRRPLPSAA